MIGFGERNACLSTTVIGAYFTGAMENMIFQKARLFSKTDAAPAL